MERAEGGRRKVEGRRGRGRELWQEVVWDRQVEAWGRLNVGLVSV